MRKLSTIDTVDELYQRSPTATIFSVDHQARAGIAEACGFRGKRFSAITHLARHVPMYRLVYPEGVQHLPDIRQAILSAIAP